MKEYQELYQWYKEMGICPQCGTNKAAPGKVRCEECLAKNAESSHKRREKQSQQQTENIRREHRTYIKKLREHRKAAGLCIYCGKPQSSNSSCMCIDCRIKNQRKNEKRKDGMDRSERPMYGRCYRCGTHIESGKLCEKCKETSIKNLEYANASEKTLERRIYIRQQNNAIFRNN